MAIITTAGISAWCAGYGQDSKPIFIITLIRLPRDEHIKPVAIFSDLVMSA